MSTTAAADSKPLDEKTGEVVNTETAAKEVVEQPVVEPAAVPTTDAPNASMIAQLSFDDGTTHLRSSLDEALFEACRRGDEEEVRRLLDKGASAITTAKDGWTALTIAAREGHETVVRLLLDNGASVDKPAKHGWTALILAAEENHEAVARLLLDSGASVDKADKDGRTALMHAAEENHQEVARLLLDAIERARGAPRPVAQSGPRRRSAEGRPQIPLIRRALRSWKDFSADGLPTAGVNTVNNTVTNAPPQRDAFDMTQMMMMNMMMNRNQPQQAARQTIVNNNNNNNNNNNINTIVKGEGDWFAEGEVTPFCAWCCGYSACIPSCSTTCTIATLYVAARLSFSPPTSPPPPQPHPSPLPSLQLLQLLRGLLHARQRGVRLLLVQELADMLRLHVLEVWGQLLLLRRRLRLPLPEGHPMPPHDLLLHALRQRRLRLLQEGRLRQGAHGQDGRAADGARHGALNKQTTTRLADDLAPKGPSRRRA